MNVKTTPVEFDVKLKTVTSSLKHCILQPKSNFHQRTLNSSPRFSSIIILIASEIITRIVIKGFKL